SYDLQTEATPPEISQRYSPSHSFPDRGDPPELSERQAPAGPIPSGPETNRQSCRLPKAPPRCPPDRPAAHAATYKSSARPLPFRYRILARGTRAAWSGAAAAHSCPCVAPAQRRLRPHHPPPLAARKSYPP